MFRYCPEVRVQARYDSLGTRYDLSRPLPERYFLTANHGWACFNRGLKQDGRKTCKEQLELAEQLGVDTLLANTYTDLSSAFSGSTDAALQLKYAYKALEHANASGNPQFIGLAYKQIAVVYKPLGDLPRSLALLKQAIANVRSRDQLNRVCCHLSDCYRLMGQADSALYWAQRSHIITDPADDDYGYARSFYISWWWGVTVINLAALRKVAWSVISGGESGWAVLVPAVIGMLVCDAAVYLGVKFIHNRQVQKATL